MTDTLLAFERNELEQFLQEYMALDRRVQRPKDIYSILRGPRERKYQYSLKYFLDPRKSHGFGDTLLRTFWIISVFMNSISRVSISKSRTRSR
jgi:hypothetical protein